jgi:Ca2+-binding RTX toxin-like protein
MPNSFSSSPIAIPAAGSFSYETLVQIPDYDSSDTSLFELDPAWHHANFRTWAEGPSFGHVNNGFYVDDSNVGKEILPTLDGDLGPVIIIAGQGNDEILTNFGDDVVLGRGGADFIVSGSGNDFVSGGDGDDHIFGQEGNDRLYGDAGNDRLYGGSGGDILMGGSGADLLAGGTGTDTASYDDATAGITASLANRSANTGDAAGDVYNSIENLTGSQFNDNLYGDSGDNVISGGAGNDRLYGNDGNDTLIGGEGINWLFGGAGDDTLDLRIGTNTASGGTGYDTALLSGSASDWQFDVRGFQYNPVTGETVTTYTYYHVVDGLADGPQMSMSGVEAVTFDDGSSIFI